MVAAPMDDGPDGVESDLPLLSSLPNLRGFYLEDVFSPNGWDEIGRLKQLEILECNSNYITDRYLNCLQHLADLKELALYGNGPKLNPFTDASLPPIAKMRRLQKLVLHSGGITDAGLNQLESLQALKSLEIEGPFTDAGLEFLKKLPNLRELILKGHFSDKGLVHLSGITSLETLTLVSDKVTGSGLSSLSRLPKLRALRFVGQPKGVSLAALTDWQHLEVLNLAADKTDDTLLASLGPIPNLKSLSLEEARVTNDGLAALEKLVTLQELDLLNMEDITDEGLRHLAPLKQLRALRLGDCGRIDLIGTPGLTVVASLPSLDFLDVSAVDITNEQLAIVTARPSLKKIVFNVRNKTIVDEWRKVQARHPDLLWNEGSLVIRAARLGNRYFADLELMTSGAPAVQNP